MSAQQPIALEQLDAEAEADRLLEEDDLAQQQAKAAGGAADSKQQHSQNEDGFEQELGELEEGELGLPRPVAAIKPVSTSSAFIDTGCALDGSVLCCSSGKWDSLNTPARAISSTEMDGWLTRDGRLVR